MDGVGKMVILRSGVDFEVGIAIWRGGPYGFIGTGLLELVGRNGYAVDVGLTGLDLVRERVEESETVGGGSDDRGEDFDGLRHVVSRGDSEVG